MDKISLIADNIRISKEVRKDILNMTYAMGSTGAHLGGSLSAVEILVALYNHGITYDKNNPNFEERDRVILSKGHAAMAFYAVLAEVGIIDKEELLTFKKDGSKLGGHPSLNGTIGVEYASGSLGQGLSLGVGACLALKRKGNNKSKVYVILGDGECDEGSIWEAVASAANFKLNNLVAIIDSNAIQYDGYTKDVMNMDSMEEKWESFGWSVISIDGHDVNQLIDAYKIETAKPKVIIAHTIKGKGVSFMENNCKYHNASLNNEAYEQAMQEVEASNVGV